MTDGGATTAMMNSIDIDIGGTFCDLVLTLAGERTLVKSPTTPLDLSICFMNAVEDAADAVDLEASELLPQIGIIRYSTTVALNRLIQRQGPRVGLITTEGHEDAILIGRGAQWVDGKRVAQRRNLAVQSKPTPLVPRPMIVGVKERVDSGGKVIRPLDEQDVRVKLRTLVDRGARAVVVSLLWSFVNPAHERRVKTLIREEYEEYHIGYLPVVLSCEVIAKLGEYERTMTAILDAYLQQAMQMELSATWDRVREHGYRGSFLLIHNSGGSAELFNTTACRTFNGGPVAGLMGSVHFAKQLGYRNVVACDMGGTSFDVGLVVESSVRNYEFRPVIDTWMVGVTMLQTVSIGAGGGSIASLNPILGNQLEVGPRSAGSMPGPACYDLGGTEPTVTDADLLLGYLDPERYFGGRMPLNRARAARAIETHIARPLGVGVEEAASLIRHVVEQNMASAIKREVHLRGYKPEDFVLFAFGGAGPTHAGGFKADVPKAVVFPTSPVFCAMGSSVVDIVHLYEVSRRMIFMEPVSEALLTEFDAFNAVVDRLVERARTDLRAEGLPIDEARFALELDMLYGGQVNVKRMASPRLRLRDAADARAVYEAFEQEFSEAFSPLVVNKPGGVYLDSFILRVTVPTPKPVLVEQELRGRDPGAAHRGERPAWWPEYGEFRDTAIFDLERLAPGNVIEGPAIVEASFTTVVISPGQRFAIDRYGLGVLEGAAGGVPAHARRERGSRVVAVRAGERREEQIRIAPPLTSEDRR
jgi:N-methylhydantoinase A/acetophenone carboxylase